MLLDKNAQTWNGGHVWIPTGDGAAAAAVSEAYAKQFQEDARKFLRNRAEEMRSKWDDIYTFDMSRTRN